AAAVCAEHGITAEPVSYETIRDALKRLGVGWRRAKTWITSPDPQYALKTAQNNGRDRLIGLAARHPAWVVGYADEVWWSRLAQPAMHAWGRCGCTPKRGPRTIHSPRLWPATGCCGPIRIGCCCALSRVAQSAASPPPFWPGGPTGSLRRASVYGCWCGTMLPGTSAERCGRGLGRITAR